MTNNRTETDVTREALWTFPRDWRVMYVSVLVVLCVGFGILASIEYSERDEWLSAPFSSITRVVISTGTASGLLSLFITEIGRAIFMFSTWLGQKLNENLEKSRARNRERIRAELEPELVAIGREEGREEGIDYGVTVGLMRAQGKEPPPPPWQTNGSERSNGESH